MFYYNKTMKKNISYKKVNYASFKNGINTDYDEKLLPVKYATTTYNYSYQNGALKTGLGIKDLEICYDRLDRSRKKKIELPEGVEAIATYTYTRNIDVFGEKRCTRAQLIKRYLALAMNMARAISIYVALAAIIENPAYSPADALHKKLARKP